MLIQPHQVRWIERNLIDNDVPFVVIGGVAVKYYRAARQTEDVDLFVGANSDVIHRMVAAIPDVARDPKAIAKLLEPKVGHFEVGGPHQIDVLSFAPGLDFDEAYRTAQPCDLAGVNFPMLSKSLLIKHKLEVGEPKDLADVELLQRG